MVAPEARIGKEMTSRRNYRQCWYTDWVSSGLEWLSWSEDRDRGFVKFEIHIHIKFILVLSKYSKQLNKFTHAQTAKIIQGS